MIGFQDVWFISDTHFSHRNIITYSRPEFKDTEQMDELMIENWNKTVKPNDLIFHLGDVFFCGAERMRCISERLNGRKILIRGNHDKGYSNGKFNKLGFQTFNYYVFEELLLSHHPQQIEPMRVLYNNTDIETNVCGHVHEQVEGLDKQLHFCVSVENINYRPIHADEIFKYMTMGLRPYKTSK